MFDPTKLVDLLKLSPRFIFALLIASSLVLFLPPSAIAMIGLSALQGSLRAYVGIAWLGSLCVLIALGCAKAWEQAVMSRTIRKHESIRIERLKSLTRNEKKFLSSWVKNNQRSGSLQMSEALLSLAW